MISSYRRWKKKRSLKKVKPGDGHALKRFRWWQGIYRSLFYMRATGPDGTEIIYAVNVNYFNEDFTAELYLNGKHHATSTLPATFPVQDGVIEVADSTYGLRRMHFIASDGTEEMLAPHPLSMEGLRLKVDKRYPTISKIIGISAVIILLTSVILGLPQLIAFISTIPMIQEHLGSFESPISLPGWANTFLVTAGIFAALERAITLRNHWLIDMETSWWDA